jgi:hypothetical protein
VHASRGATLALRDGDRALIAVCHAGCSRADILAELSRLHLLDGPADFRPPAAPVTELSDGDATARRVEIARRIWGAARDARGSPVVAYLAFRGITIAPPPALRRAPSLRRPERL